MTPAGTARAPGVHRCRHGAGRGHARGQARENGHAGASTTADADLRFSSTGTRDGRRKDRHAAPEVRGCVRELRLIFELDARRPGRGLSCDHPSHLARALRLLRKYMTTSPATSKVIKTDMTFAPNRFVTRELVSLP